MPHIHELIDFTVVAFLVHKDRVLLIFHTKLQKWLPLGGHIELDENPDQALFREIQEESGLKEHELEVFGEKPSLKPEGRKFLYAPAYLDIHDIDETHRHVGMVYFVKAKSDSVKLAQAEHDEIRWVTAEGLQDPALNLQPDVKFYAREALKRACA